MLYLHAVDLREDVGISVLCSMPPEPGVSFRARLIRLIITGFLISRLRSLVTDPTPSCTGKQAKGTNNHR